MSKVWNYKSDQNDKLAEQVAKDDKIVMTKPAMAIDLIKLIEFKDGDVVMDPCKGDGAFYDNLPDNVVKKWCEINEDVDYLTNEDKVDITLSNPPFCPRKLFWDFHIRAMQNTRRFIYWLINMSALNVFTPRRLDIMKKEGWFIEKMHIVNDRRWFGRYVFIKIGKDENKSCITYEITNY